MRDVIRKGNILEARISIRNGQRLDETVKLLAADGFMSLMIMSARIA
jgi:hypothetical protein